MIMTDLQQTLDPLPRGHHDGGHHPGQRPGRRQLGRAQDLALPRLQVLPDAETHEADREDWRCGHNWGSHACNEELLRM